MPALWLRANAAVSTGAESTTSHRAQSSKASARRRKSASATPVSARRRRGVAVAREQAWKEVAVLAGDEAEEAGLGVHRESFLDGGEREHLRVGHLGALVARPLAADAGASSA